MKGNRMLNQITVGTSDAKYNARVWRTELLRKEAANETAKMLQAFIPEGFTVQITECDEQLPVFPHASNYRFRGILRDSKIDGSDAHFFVQAYTREGVTAKLLAHILDGQGFFPLT